MTFVGKSEVNPSGGTSRGGQAADEGSEADESGERKEDGVKVSAA